MELLHIQDLTFHYPEADQNALEDISLSIRSGEFTVLCGESGCGKTTLLKLLKRELAPFGETSGGIFYNGIAQADLDPRTAAADIGFVLQDPDSQIVTDKVWHELAFGLESLGYPPPVIRRRVAEMAAYFGIEDWFRKNVNDLSGGQKQLLNLASVMVMQPQLLLLDEPTAQLDPIAAANFIGTLQKLNRELGLTILLVEHRLEEVFPLANRVLLMDKGKLLYTGTPRDMGVYFQTNPSHPMLAGLPAAMRIYNGLDVAAACPLTVREGRDFVTQNFDNRVDTMEEKPYIHSDKIMLELKDIWFRYDKKQPDILRGVSLTVYEGEHVCLLGGNGAGKTTMLGIMAGLLKAYRGKVLIDGQKIDTYTDRTLYRHNVALLPQNPQTVFLAKTVREDLAETGKAMEYKLDETERRMAEIAGKLGIAPLLSMHPYDLSGGEQQKAALAKMLLLQPKLLLLDEPTKGIDAYAKQTLAAILKQLKQDGITIVTVTHDVEFAAATADRCAMLFDGEVVSVDTPTAFFAGNTFYTTAANRIVRGYYQNVVLCEDVIALCQANSRKEVASP